MLNQERSLKSTSLTKGKKGTYKQTNKQQQQQQQQAKTEPSLSTTTAAATRQKYK